MKIKIQLVENRVNSNIGNTIAPINVSSKTPDTNNLQSVLNQASARGNNTSTVSKIISEFTRT